MAIDVINLFDAVSFIRDHSGIGVFAPQYGPRGASLRACRRNSE